MGVAKDITGQKYNRLTAVRVSHKAKDGFHWVFKCDCGNEIVRRISPVINGNTKSCGCWKSESCTSRSTKHGLRHTPEWNVWQHIKKRVDGRDSNREKYVEHGIDMCKEWYDDFQAFYDYVGPRPSDSHSIGRIDNFQGYHPGNVRWETDEQQSRNRSRMKSNRTGVAGVGYMLDKGEYYTFKCTAVVNGQQRSRSFSVSKYGEELAFFLACEQRDQWILINKLCFGIEYAEEHGMSKEEYDARKKGIRPSISQAEASFNGQ